MKNTALLSIFLLFTLTYILKASPLSLYVVADDDFPPYSFVKKKKVTGIDVDIVKEMGRRLNINIKVNLFPWKRLIMMTKTGRCDGSMSLFHSRNREKFALFTYPLHYSTFVLFVKKGNEFQYSTIKDLFGKNLAKQSGFIISEEFDRAVSNKKIEVSEIFKVRDGIKYTLMEISDGLVANKHVTLYKLNQNVNFSTFKDKFSILPKPIKQKRAAYFVLSKNAKIKNKANLQKRITGTFRSMDLDGTYQKLVNSYIY